MPVAMGAAVVAIAMARSVVAERVWVAAGVVMGVS